MLKNVGIAGKLALIVLLPMLGLAYFAGAKVLASARTASDADRLQHDTRLAVEVSGFVHESQKERGLTALFVGSKGATSGGELGDQRALTDERLAKLQALTGKLSAPVLKVGDKPPVTGFNPDVWQQLLDDAGYPRSVPQRALARAAPKAPEAAAAQVSRFAPSQKKVRAGSAVTVLDQPPSAPSAL